MSIRVSTRSTLRLLALLCVLVGIVVVSRTSLHVPSGDPTPGGTGHANLDHEREPAFDHRKERPQQQEERQPLDRGSLELEIEHIMAETRLALSRMLGPAEALVQIEEWNRQVPVDWRDCIRRDFALATVPDLVAGSRCDAGRSVQWLVGLLTDSSDSIRQAYCLSALYGVEGDIRFDLHEDRSFTLLRVARESVSFPSTGAPASSLSSFDSHARGEEAVNAVGLVFRTTQDSFLRDLALKALSLLGVGPLLAALGDYDFESDPQLIGPLYRTLASTNTEEAVGILQAEETKLLCDPRHPYPVPYVSRILASLGRVNGTVLERAKSILDDPQAKNADAYKAADLIARAMTASRDDPYDEVAKHYISTHMDPSVVRAFVSAFVSTGTDQDVPWIKNMLEVAPVGLRRDYLFYMLETIDETYDGPRSLTGTLNELENVRSTEMDPRERRRRIDEVNKSLTQLKEKDFSPLGPRDE